MDLPTPLDFSSPGPLRTGVRKPDVKAPGAMLVSARSSATQMEDRDLVSQTYMVMAGARMACPFVAGVLALLAGWRLLHGAKIGHEDPQI